MLQQFDPRNKDIQVWVGDGLVHRDAAKVSVFDSSVQGGDAVWEGMRVYKHGVYCLDRHLDRLEDSALAMALKVCRRESSLRKPSEQLLRPTG